MSSSNDDLIDTIRSLIGMAGGEAPETLSPRDRLAFAFAQDWSQAAKLGFIGINQWQLLCFFLFWALNIGVILAGIESIKWLETFSAPLLLLIGLALLGWGVTEGGGLGHVLGKSSQFSSSSFSEGTSLFKMPHWWAVSASRKPVKANSRARPRPASFGR